MARIAMYAGSFDPVTLGHLDVIRRGAALFDEVVVAVGVNSAKQGWFTAAQRGAMLRDACADIPNVRVTHFSGLAVDAAREAGATAILRGLRALSDFEVEFRYGLANRDLAGIETLFLLTDPRHIFISSSMVKEIAANGGSVDRYVPPAVLEAIRARLT
ncbi:MAG: pantetheine-phosphate adenylyltransferase [Deltaproteobacteria bacterium]|nr:pantetheine-phosphate adenylyltransferase [Deltaproteobacteria bacterium]